MRRLDIKERKQQIKAQSWLVGVVGSSPTATEQTVISWGGLVVSLYFLSFFARVSLNWRCYAMHGAHGRMRRVKNVPSPCPQRALLLEIIAERMVVFGSVYQAELRLS